MNSIARTATALCLAALATAPLVAGADEAPSLGAVEALRIATEAYIYGYPLVTFDMARRQQTNVNAPDVFLIGGDAVTKDLQAAFYNTTDLNNKANPRDTCPAALWAKVGSIGSRFWIGI